MAEDFVGTLDQTRPAGSEFLSGADDQMRQIKQACKASFPNVTGPVTLTHSQINALPGSVTSAQTALKNTLDPHGYTTIGGSAAATVVPRGGIIEWNHNMGAIPSGWRLCDGGTYNGVVTPDLRGRFIIGQASTHAGARALAESATVGSGGAHTHTLSIAGHALTTNQLPAHSHDITIRDDSGNHANVNHSVNDGTQGSDASTLRNGKVVTQETGGGQAHTHSGSTANSGGAHTHAVTSILPLRYVLAKICYCGG